MAKNSTNVTIDTPEDALYCVAVNERTPAPRKAITITIRFRTKAEVERIKRAAKWEGLTFNTFVAGRAAKAAEETIALMAKQGGNLEPTDGRLQPSFS